VPNDIGINSTATSTTVFATKVTVQSGTMTFQTTGGPLSFTSPLDINGNTLKGIGPITTTALGSSNAGAKYEVVSGTQALSFDGTTGTNVAELKVTGGQASGDGTLSTNLVVTNGSWVGNGSFNNVASTGGLLNLDGGAGLSLGGTYVQSPTGSTLMSANADNTSSSVFGNFELGGSLTLNGAGLGTSLFPIGTTWGLFSGVNYTGGSPSALNDASNFSAFALTNSPSSPYNGTFTKYGQEWTSPVASDGTYLVFQAASGSLVVVPEPSTMVFAGLGVAMSGWTMWKKRRLGKLLAAKAG
jgi:hypothetical protein